MSHPAKKHWYLPLAAAALALFAAGIAHAGSVTLGYDGDGVYPVQASANSERYFRAIVSWAPASESFASLTLSGVNGQNVMWPNMTAADGVAIYTISTGTTITLAITIGPYASYDDFGQPHQGTIGQVGRGTGIQFTFRGVFVSSSGASTVTATSTYDTQYDNADILQWWSGAATGVDPLTVDGTDVTADNGSGSSAYTFRVQYKILEYAGTFNLLPRFGTPNYPPGPHYTFVDMDNGLTSPQVAGDRDQDWWTYHRWQDTWEDRTGFWITWHEPEVVLIIDNDRTRPHFLVRSDPSDSQARDENGIRYEYTVLPTDYANFMDNVFLFSYDPPGPDVQDGYFSNMNGRPLSNNYVAMSAGGHTYEFLATDDFSPANSNRAWVQVGRPGNGLYNDYVRNQPYNWGPVETTRMMTRFLDSDGNSGGYGYPYDSQDTTQYPNVNPVLTAYPYFPLGSIDPGYSSIGPNPPGAAANPFPTEVGAGPNPPQRYTNDDTILPNFVNIQPNTSATPFRGGKWTSSNTYTFRINYWQSANTSPQYVRLYVRKNDHGTTPGSWRAYTMEKLTPADTTYANGCVYQFQATPDQLPDSGGAGDYNYYFETSDGIRTAKFPNRPATPAGTAWQDWADLGVPQDPTGNNDYYAFRVNHAPVLSAQTVTPPSGPSGSGFQFAVTYTDTDGEMLNANPAGDRPFETSIFVDLFGNPNGQAAVGTVQGETGLTYTIGGSTTNGYAADSLVNYTVEMQTGMAAGSSYRIIANTATTITLAAGSRLSSDGARSGDRFRIANWFQGTMTPADATDTNYSDGKTYIFDTATHVVLGPGSHRYHFQFRDDWGSWMYPDDSDVKVEGEQVRYPEYTGEFEGPEVLPNTAPKLSNYRFTPDSISGSDGTTATGFVFSVTYTDLEDNPPALIRLGIDGTADAPAIVLNMTKENPSDDVYSDGTVYQTPAVRLSEGSHVFRAQASDGDLRFPLTPAGATFLFTGPEDPANPGGYLDSVAGPLVAANTPPKLTFPAADRNETDPTNPPGLEPNRGNRTTQFTYTVIYTDTDRFAGVAGNPPDYVKVFIDNQPYTMTKVDATDNDYTDGVIYQYQVTGLVEGTPHTYYFVASDGLDQARKPATGVSPSYYRGPVVDEPPGAPVSLLAQDTPNDNGGSIGLTWNASTDDGGGAGDVASYVVYRTTTAGQYTAANQVATVPATGSAAYSYSDTTATTGIDYYYVVRALDAGGNESVSSNEEGPVKAIDNIPPEPPTAVAATNPGLGGTVNLTWTLSVDDGGGQNDVKEYRIYRRTTGGYTTPLTTVVAGTASYQDTTATDGTTYYYMLRSFDGANESEDSNETEAVTPSDDVAPVIAGLSPANRAVDVDPAAPVSFTATDTGSGVDLSTLVVTAQQTVNGVTSNFDLGTPADSVNGKTVTRTYNAHNAFDYRAVVTLQVTVADLGGKSQTLNDWRFTVAGPPTSTVSGTVLLADGTPLAGVTVAAGVLAATTDASGAYEIKGLADGTYTVTPQLTNYSFTPEAQSVTVPGSATGVNFTAAAGFDIAGRVLNTNGQPLADVTVSDGIHSSVTNSEGRWRLRDLGAGTYTITPSLPNYVFDPAYRVVNVSTADVTGQTFTGSLQTFTISGTVADAAGNRLATATVEATDGTKTVEAVTSTSGAYTLSGLLPGRWTVSARKSGYVFQPENQVIDLAADVANIGFVGYPVYSLTLDAGLHFVALPVTPQDNNPLSVFGNTAMVARYDPTLATPRYVVASADDTAVPTVLQVGPGKGFWVREPLRTTARAAGELVSNGQSINLQLADGWNMAGNPYDAVLPWSNVGIISGGPVRDFGYVYDPASGGYQLVSDLPGISALTAVPKNAGMWMRSSGQRTVTVNPIGTAARATASYSRQAGDFVIPIVATAGNSTDATARLGVLAYAKDNPGAYAIDNPPAVRPFVDVYFVGDDQSRLTCDIRGENAGTLSYNFVVNTDMVDTPVKLALPDLSQVGRDKSITLVDLASGKRLYARTLTAYTYNSGQGGPREFRLEIAPANAGGALTIGAASAQGTAQGMTISYALSREATVTATVLNLSGRMIRTLGAGAMTAAGVNSLSWDLRSTTGTTVPAGSYLIRLTAAADDGQQASTIIPASVRR